MALWSPLPAGAVLVGGAVMSIDGGIVVLANAAGESTIELVGDAAPLAATLSRGDLVNATGKVGANGRVVVDDPAHLTRLGASSPTITPATPALADYAPQTHQFAAPSAPQTGPLVAFAAVFGLTVLLVVGAFAVKLGWLNRARNWPNRLKTRFTRI